jgi:hypothetical protein
MYEMDTQTLEDYNTFCEALPVDNDDGVDMPKIRLARCRVVVETVDGFANLEKRLRRFAPELGWLKWQSSEPPLIAFVNGDMAKVLKQLSEKNVILEGEFTKGNQSVQLRYNDIDSVGDSWHWLVVEEIPVTNSEAVDSWQALAVTHQMLGKKDKNVNWMDYQVYWRYDDKQGYRPAIARLVKIQLLSPVGAS